MAALRRDVNPLLLRTSELVRAGVPGRTRDHRGADLIGARLRGADLREADLIGADFRDTDLRGADLTGSIFLTQPQVNAAKGDAAAKLPPALARPAHW